ncbi:hypothetical protein [Pantanalinema sp. GBBB05]|uniref:hypothetical protein n=1 Tax=Pantanalinema sp. GBBB05 TaxID=2604139 RepID=UPI003D8163EB
MFVDLGILQNQGNSMPRPKCSFQVLDKAERRIATTKADQSWEDQDANTTSSL